MLFVIQFLWSEFEERFSYKDIYICTAVSRFLGHEIVKTPCSILTELVRSVLNNLYAVHTKVRQAAFFKFLSQKVISIVRPFCREALNDQTFTLLQLLPGAVHVGFNAAVDLLSVSEPPVKQPTQLATKQSVLTTSGKPVSKQPTVARKPAAQKPAMKSTYNASYGRHAIAGMLDTRTNQSVD